ncbi:hypothetical protein U1Q18_030179 [Sarracenia purpurea var. burkii]
MLTLTQSNSTGSGSNDDSEEFSRFTKLEVWAVGLSWAEEVFPWAAEIGPSRATEITLSIGALPEQNDEAHPERRSSWYLDRPQRGPEQWALTVGAKQAVPSYRR